MKVHQLIQMLERCEPDAEVLIATQQSCPFESSIKGIAVRADFDDPTDADQDGTIHGLFNLDDSERPKRASDVVILEGMQRARGNREAWEAVRRW